MLLGWGGWGLIKAVRGRLETAEPAQMVGVALFSATVLLLVIGFGGLDTAWKRWSGVNQQFSANNPRLLAAGVCVDMLPHSGWFGFGPGTFRTAFPFYNKHTGPETRGVWLYAHEDYLQILVEWGWIGAVLFAIAVFGGVGQAVWLLTRRHRRFFQEDYVLAVASLAGLGAVLVHALGDFPLQVASIQLYVATLLGLLWSVGLWTARPKQRVSA